MMYLTKPSLIVMLFLFGTLLQAQLLVDTIPDPQLMLETHFDGYMESITNLETVGNPDYWGIFDATDSNIGLSTGIIMANGDVRLAMGVNDLLEVGIFDDTGLIGDSDLDDLTGLVTEDASILEFDFVPTTDLFYIHFVFASEEYPEWVANEIYNDVFAIWLDGENVALLPDETYVCVNNLHCFGGNSEYYICNDPMNEDTTPCDGIFGCPETIEETTNQYDGFNIPLAAPISVTAGTTHHLKIGIADATDNGADSGVFLKVSNTVEIPETVKAEIKFSVYPNPSNGEMRIDFGNSIPNELKVYSLAGDIIQEFDKEKLTLIEFRLELSAGIYILECTYDGEVRKERVVFQ